MKIRTVVANNHKKAFELRTSRGAFDYPFAKLALKPTADDRVVKVFPDPEIGREAFTYQLESGREDTVHIDAVLEYHQDPGYLNEMLLHRLTVEAGKAIEQGNLAKRELARRLGTSPSQLYRLLDPANSRKSAGPLLAILHLLGREVDLVVRLAAPRAEPPARLHTAR